MYVSVVEGVTMLKNRLFLILIILCSIASYENVCKLVQ